VIEFSELVVPFTSAVGGAGVGSVAATPIIWWFLRRKLEREERMQDEKEAQFQARLAAVETAHQQAPCKVHAEQLRELRERIAPVNTPVLSQQIATLTQQMDRTEGKLDKAREQIAAIAEGGERDHEYIGDVRKRLEDHLTEHRRVAAA